MTTKQRPSSRHAAVFEVAFNTVMQKGEERFGAKGQAGSKLDYRCVLEATLCVVHHDDL
jgi:hypothetical protein